MIQRFSSASVADSQHMMFKGTKFVLHVRLEKHVIDSQVKSSILGKCCRGAAGDPRGGCLRPGSRKGASDLILPKN
jgi:hypothetical protein